MALHVLGNGSGGQNGTKSLNNSRMKFTFIQFKKFTPLENNRLMNTKNDFREQGVPKLGKRNRGRCENVINNKIKAGGTI